MPQRFLVRHVGNMGDMVFLVPPALATLKRLHPDCHITFVTAWGFKDKRGRWGKRGSDGYCIALMLTNPHVDQLIHWHDSKTALSGDICQEEGRRIPTWSRQYYEEKKKSGGYDGVFELDFGLKIDDNPITAMYERLGLPNETYAKTEIYLTEKDRAVAAAVMADAPRPRIVLLESIESETTRGWDPEKIPVLEEAINKTYGVRPLWFGSRHIPFFEGCPLSLRENIALLTLCDVGIGVMSGPTHFAAAVGLPTLTLYCDQPLHRAAPAYFLNQYIADPARRHRTLLGPSPAHLTLLKSPEPPAELTPAEKVSQHYRGWQHPGRQSTKSCLAVITVDEVMAVLADMLPAPVRV